MKLWLLIYRKRGECEKAYGFKSANSRMAWLHANKFCRLMGVKRVSVTEVPPVYEDNNG